jgi:hypothetical protein
MKASLAELLDLARLGAALEGASRDELPEALGGLARLHAMVLARLTTPLSSVEPMARDRFLTPDEAAELAAVPRARILTWARGARWAVRPTRKCLRISEVAFRRWLSTRPA